MVEDKDYVDMCVVCKEAVPKSDLVYKKGKVFHSQCFDEHGNTFPDPNNELAALSAKTRIELVQMKNLKARTEQGILKLNPTSKKSKKTGTKKTKTKKRVKKPKRIKSKKRKSKTKAKRTKPKRRQKSKSKGRKRR